MSVTISFAKSHRLWNVIGDIFRPNTTSRLDTSQTQKGQSSYRPVTRFITWWKPAFISNKCLLENIARVWSSRYYLKWWLVWFYHVYTWNLHINVWFLYSPQTVIQVWCIVITSYTMITCFKRGEQLLFCFLFPPSKSMSETSKEYNKHKTNSH